MTILSSNNGLGYGLDFKGNLVPYVRGTWASPWFDTRSAGFSVAWASYTASVVTPAGTAASYEFRSATTSNQSDATAWTSTINTLTGRYIQARATLSKDDTTTTPPKLDALTLTPTSTQGFLLEPTATNKALQSQTFNTTWSPVTSVVSANQAIAPDGTLTADLLRDDATAAAQHRLDQNITITANAVCTISIYAKAAYSPRSIYLRFRENGGASSQFHVVYNLVTGAVIAASASGGGALTSYGIQTLPGGWYRVWATGTLAAAVTLGIFTVNLHDGSTDTYSGNSVSGIYLWGAQLEEGPLTSYLVTTTGSASRNADTVTVSNNLINPASGSFLIKSNWSGDKCSITAAGTYVLLDTKQAGGGRNDRIYLLRYSNVLTLSIVNEAGSTTNIIYTITTAVTEGWHTVGVKWDANEASLWLDGVKVATSTAAGLPERFGADLYIGASPLDANNWRWNDVISSLTILHKSLPDWQMALYTILGYAPYDKPTYRLNFESNLNIITEGIWTSPWRPNRTSPTLKHALAQFSSQPASTDYAVEHRAANIGFDDPETKALIFARGSDAYDPVTLINVATKSHPRYVTVAGTVGLLVEEGTTNTAQYSQEFDNAWWVKTNCTITANAATAPDGTATADALVDNGTNGQHYLTFTAGVLTNGTTGTLSIYAKANSLGFAWLQFTGGKTAIFNLSTGTLGTVDSGVTATITLISNGWYRITASVAVTAGTAGYVGASATNSAAGYAGTNQSIYIWGAQAEVKAYPTSYMPTSGATATRSADDMKILTANAQVNLKEGAAIFRIYVDGDLSPLTSAATHYIFHPGTGAGDNLILAKASGWTATYGASGSTVSTSWNSTLSVGWHTIAVRWNSSELSIWADGVKRSSVSVTSQPTAWQTYTRVLQALNGTAQWSQPVAWVGLYHTSPTDAQMASYTNTAALTDAHLYWDFTKQTLVPQDGYNLASEWKNDITQLPECEYIQHRVRLFANDSAQVPEVSRLDVYPV